MPRDWEGGDEGALPSLLSGAWYTRTDTCLLSRWSRPVRRRGCSEESLFEVAAVVARFKLPLPIEGYSR